MVRCNTLVLTELEFGDGEKAADTVYTGPEGRDLGSLAGRRIDVVDRAKFRAGLFLDPSGDLADGRVSPG